MLQFVLSCVRTFFRLNTKNLSISSLFARLEKHVTANSNNRSPVMILYGYRSFESSPDAFRSFGMSDC